MLNPRRGAHGRRTVARMSGPTKPSEGIGQEVYKPATSVETTYTLSRTGLRLDNRRAFRQNIDHEPAVGLMRSSNQCCMCGKEQKWQTNISEGTALAGTRVSLSAMA